MAKAANAIDIERAGGAFGASIDRSHPKGRARILFGHARRLLGL